MYTLSTSSKSAIRAVSTHALKHIFIYTFIAFCIYRILRIERKFSYKIDRDWFFLKQGFLSDSMIIGFCLLLYVIISSTKNRIIKISGKLIISLGVFIYCFDVVLFKFTEMRLIINDIIKFSKDLGDIASMSIDLALTPDGILVVFFAIILIAMCYFFIKRSTYISGKSRITLSIISIMLITLSLQMNEPEYCHAWIYENIFTINKSATVNRSYSDSSSQKALQYSKQTEIGRKVTPGLQKEPNIILLLVESFSSYQSNFFSGLNDMTPNLDRLARENRAYTNFHANGFTTEGGLIAILTGVVPIPCPASFSNEMKGLFSFEGFYNPDRSLPALLNKKGYHTEFITPGKTSYSNKQAWLSNIGFDTITGDDHPDYDGWPRYKFNAAPDEALYLHVLNRINSSPSANPFFYLVENVSTHFPFFNPETKEQTEKAAFAYGDKQIGIFVEKLRELNFFENGILIITGDHRTMTPVDKREFNLFGKSAPARVPLIVVDKSSQGPAVITEPFQQTDFISSIECLTGDSCETTFYSGSFLVNTTPAHTVVAVNGSNRNLVNLYTNGSVSQILLDGVETRPINGTVPDHIIDKINHERVKHLKYGMSASNYKYQSNDDQDQITNFERKPNS